MKLEYKFESETPQQLKYFLKNQRLSKGLLAKVKFKGGLILVNGTERTVRWTLELGDIVEVVIPAEAEHETLLRYDAPLDIVFEDDFYLLVNKPSGVASIQSQYHPNGTMANRVKNYIMEQDYEDKVVHVVTRLDRDTTGLMLFAKNGFAHALMDIELKERRITKKYFALVSASENLDEHAFIEGAIGRDLSSILKRQVVEEGGKNALTEYKLISEREGVALIDIILHTGRTHQIRVHFSHIGAPLLGDEMYGGRMDLGITRQALHCHNLKFKHPVTGEDMNFEVDLPEDMKEVLG